MSTGFDLLPLLYKEPGRVMRHPNVSARVRRVMDGNLQLLYIDWRDCSDLSGLDEDGWYLLDEKREFTKQELKEALSTSPTFAHAYPDKFQAGWAEHREMIHQCIDKLFVGK